jgi:PAS domain S-box-containing protein
MDQSFDCVECKKLLKNEFKKRSKNIKESLKKEVDIFIAYFENNNTGNIIWNIKKSNIVYFNSYFYELLRLEKNNITNFFVKKFFDFENNLEIKKIIFGEINNLIYEKKYVLSENESLWLGINISLYKDNLLVRVNDITDSKKDKANLDSLLENIDNFIWSMDKNYNLISFNSNFYKYIFNNFGISISIGFNLNYFLDKYSFWLDSYEKAFTGESVVVEIQVNSNCFKANINPIFINNEVIGISIFSQDITEKKKKERELEDINNKFKNAFEYSPIGIAIIGLDGKFLKINSSISYITGYSEEELLDITFQDITHPDDLKTDLSYLNEVISGIINNYNIEKRYIHKDGHIVYAFLSVSVVKDNNNNPLYFLSQIKDITVKKINEEHIRLNQSKLLSLVENTQDFIWSVDLENKIVFYNSHFKKFILDTFQVYLKEGLFISNVLNEQELYIWNSMYHKSLKGKFLSREIQWSNKYYSLSLNPIRDGEFIIGVSVFAKDITSKKESQLEILSKNIELEKKNEELEQFAYLVSHDLQAPLNSIKSYISMLDNKHIFGSEKENIDEYVRTNIVNSCNKMKSFISDLLLYSKAGIKLPLEHIDTNIVLDNVINNLKFSIEQVKSTVKYEELPDILANPLKIEQLFQNLIDNALKYRKENIEPIINIKCISEVDFWKFSIQDNGIGINSKYQDVVFKTFRRLHSDDKYSGNGIGLSICKKIVEQYKGDIWFESTLGQGTTFYFTIPKITKN